MVVPVHNHFELVRAAVGSVDRPAEIIVVDDCSDDGAADRVEAELPSVTLLRNDRNVGFGVTANRGLARASGRVRVVLNSDARLRPGALGRLVAAFDDPRVGVAGPRLVFPDGSHQLSAARFPTPQNLLAGSFLLNDAYRRLRPGGRFRWELGMSRADHGRDQDVDWVMGACLALRDAAYAATGGFDPGYFMYMEEADLCLRAARAGWRVRYVAGAVVEHVGGGSGGDPRRQARLLLANERRFMARAYGPGADRAWRRSRLLGSAVKAAVLAPLAPFDARVRGRLAWQWTALRTVAAMGRVPAVPCGPPAATAGGPGASRPRVG